MLCMKLLFTLSKHMMEGFDLEEVQWVEGDINPMPSIPLSQEDIDSQLAFATRLRAENAAMLASGTNRRTSGSIFSMFAATTKSIFDRLRSGSSVVSTPSIIDTSTTFTQLPEGYNGRWTGLPAPDGLEDMIFNDQAHFRSFIDSFCRKNMGFSMTVDNSTTYLIEYICICGRKPRRKAVPTSDATTRTLSKQSLYCGCEFRIVGHRVNYKYIFKTVGVHNHGPIEMTELSSLRIPRADELTPPMCNVILQGSTLEAQQCVFQRIGVMPNKQDIYNLRKRINNKSN